MNKRMKTLISSLLVLVLIAATALAMTACQVTTETTVEPTETALEATPEAGEETGDTAETVLGEGAKSFHVEVTDADGNKTLFLVKTDEETLDKALLGVELVAGDDSEYGLYIKTVNGITADYSVDQTYWAFYINGEMASVGVSATSVEDGATYAFRVEK